MIGYRFLFLLFYFFPVRSVIGQRIVSRFMFNSARSERMLITYCSSYTSSVAASSTGFLLKKSVNFKLLPAICGIAISKCASRSNHLVSLALYCRLHRFILINGSNVPMLVGLYIKRLTFRISKIGTFRNPTQPLIILIPQSSNFVRFHLNNYFRMLSVLFLIVSAIM